MRKNDTSKNITSKKSPRTPRMPSVRKTAKGRRACSLNAIKHGLLASELIIEKGIHREKREDFERLLAEIRDDLKPDGRLEELYIERIASIWWRLRRSVRWERSVIEQLSATIEAHNSNDDANEPKNAREFMQRLTHPDLPDYDHHCLLLRWIEIEMASLRSRKQVTEDTEQLLRLIGDWSISFVDLINDKTRMHNFDGPPPDEVRDTFLGVNKALEGLDRRRIEIMAELAKMPQPDPDSHDQWTESRLFHYTRYERALELQLYSAIMQLRLLRELKAESSGPELRND